jgi:hypothetical protein
MGKVSELVVGSVSLRDSFNTIIKYFDRIQLNIQPDDACQKAILQLAVLKLRLSRWRDAVLSLIEVNDPALQNANGPLLKSYLDTMERIFEQEQENSEAIQTSPNTAEVLSNHWLIRAIQTPSLKHLRPAHGEKERTSNPHDSKLVISDGTAFLQLVVKITAVVDNLEVFPSDALDHHLKRMRSEDVKEIESQPESNKKDLQYLEGISMVVDTKFASLLNKERSGHEYSGNRARDDARLVQGDAFSTEYKEYVNEINRGQHSYINTVASERAKVVQGDLYGFNPAV